MKKIIKQEQWVMLSTEDKTQIIVPTRGVGKGVLHNKEYYGSAMLDMGDEYQHLYLTSSDEIKEGDWMFIDEKGTKRNPGRGYVLTQHKGNPASKLNAICGGTVKIIATTDKSLKVDTDLEDRVDVLYNNKLPQIPESFIKYYVEKQGKVGDVETLYNFTGITISGENEIIIKLPKEKMYSKKDVHVLIADVIFDYKQYALNRKVTLIEANTFRRDWIKENL